MPEMTTWTTKRWMLAVLAVYVVALGVRLVWLAEARHNPLYQWPTIDERMNHEIAKSLANGTAPDTAYLRAPLYLYFVGGIYKVIGPDSLGARWIQTFVAAAIPVLVCLIGGRLFNRTVGLGAGLLASVYWTAVFFSTELLDVTLACVFYLLLLYMLVALDDRRWWMWLACGVVMGIAAITRPNILAFAPFLALLALWRAWRRRPKAERRAASGWLKPGLVHAALLTVGCVAAIAPVTLRNLIVAKEPVLIAAWGSGAFWTANNELSDAKRNWRPPIDTSSHPMLEELRKDPWFTASELAESMYIYAAQELGHQPTYAETSAFYKRLALEYIRNHPGKLLMDMAKRFCYTFNAFEYPFNKDLYHFLEFSKLLWTLSWLHFGLVCPMAMFGLLAAVSRRTWPNGLVYVLVLIAALAIPGTLFPVTARYRLPLVYLLIPFAAFGVYELVRLLTPPVRWQRLGQPIAVIAAFAIFCNVNVLGLRPAPVEYLWPHFLAASVTTGRHDLADETSDNIEEALADPAREVNVPPGTAALLFRHYAATGDRDRALRLAEALLRRGEKADAKTYRLALRMLTQAGNREAAAMAVRALEYVAQGASTPDLAAGLYRFGVAFNDEAALARSIVHLENLCRSRPENQQYLNALRAARKALVKLRARPLSMPTDGLLAP